MRGSLPRRHHVVTVVSPVSVRLIGIRPIFFHFTVTRTFRHPRHESTRVRMEAAEVAAAGSGDAEEGEGSVFDAHGRT